MNQPYPSFSVAEDGWEWAEEYLRLWAQEQMLERSPARLALPRKSAGFIGGGYGGYGKPAEEWQ